MIKQELTAAESWKCPECRQKFGPGTKFIVYVKWFGCPACAVLTSCGRPVKLEVACPDSNTSPAS